MCGLSSGQGIEGQETYLVEIIDKREKWSQFEFIETIAVAF
jgi:hypothetical protein